VSNTQRTYNWVVRVAYDCPYKSTWFSVLSAPSTAITRFTHTSLTVPESRLLLSWLVQMYSTGIPSLVKGFTHSDSMWTVCILVKHKQTFIKVPVKSTVTALELVHVEVYGPLSALIFRDNQYYILFIDDYTRCASVWLLPHMKVEICTSAYQSFQTQVDSMGYEIKLFQCNNGQG